MMAYMRIDTSPVSVEYDYNHEERIHRPVVYLHGEPVWEGDWESSYSEMDLEGLKYEWTCIWENFQVKLFKEWLKNESGTS